MAWLLDILLDKTLNEIMVVPLLPPFQLYRMDPSKELVCMSTCIYSYKSAFLHLTLVANHFGVSLLI